MSATERALRASPYILDAGIIQTEKGIEALIQADHDALADNGLLNPEEAIGIELSTLATNGDLAAPIAAFTLKSGPVPRDQNGHAIQEKPRAAELEEADRAWVNIEPRKSAWSVISEIRPGENIGLDEHLLDQLGVDSFGLTRLSLDLEQATGVLIPPADLARLPTVRAVLSELSHLAANGRNKAAAENSGPDTDQTLSVAEKLFRSILVSTNDFLVHSFYSVEVSGTENLEALSDTGGIVFPNHLSDLDPLILAYALPAALRERTVWAAIRSRVFDHPAKREIARVMNVFPVDEAAPEEAVSMALKLLEEKKC